jgi:hypothetical protein
MTRLVLGPLLRRVDGRSATVWVETDRPCTVGVLGRSAPTFTVHGHHYALVDIDGLDPGSDIPYEVTLDDSVVWPEPGSPFPVSRIRTPGTERSHRIAFGSCRQAPDAGPALGLDALSAYGHAIAGGEQPPPTVLLMIGDQIYADETGPGMRRFIGQRRNLDVPPHGELSDFAEYAEQYRRTWSDDPAVRWLLSTVPTLMIFDDHDIRDDWNTSLAWREWATAQPWWRDRITHGLSAYWIYQHLGNLTPGERAADPLLTAVRAAGGDAGGLVAEFAERADREPAAAVWSYIHELPGTRIVVTDSRCRRVLDPANRAMLDGDEQARLDAECTGGLDHLFVVSSLPYLLPPSIHQMENWSEALGAGAWGPRAAAFAERLRRRSDLEHWAAFDRSFRAVAGSVKAVAKGERGSTPATITFLGGDVHHAYLARVKDLPITQIVASPFRNPLSKPYKLANQVAGLRFTYAPTRLLSRLAGNRRPPLRWRITEGPWFENNLAVIDLDERVATVTWLTPSSPTSLTALATTRL